MCRGPVSQCVFLSATIFLSFERLGGPKGSSVPQNPVGTLRYGSETREWLEGGRK